MFRKTVSGIMLTLLLISMLTLAFNIQSVKASGIFYAEGDNSFASIDALLEADRIIGNRHVKYWEHVINGIIYVKNDFVLMHTDVESGEIIEYQKNWRDIELKNVESKPFEPRKEYFWKKLVVFLDREEWGYFYTFNDTHEYPFVCWEVRHVDGTTIMYDLDGLEVGFGIPAPSNGFSLSGYNTASWPDPWITYRQNADSWFNEWCETTASISLPTPSTISYYVSDLDYEYFYELAHGGSYYFQADSIGSYYYSSNVATDMFLRSPMRFAFIGSCEGMTHTGSGTFSYEFRKGQLINTTTIGYTGMASSPGWFVALEWQDYMFQKMNEGYTIKTSFDLASAEYPTIAPNVRFVGDPNLKVYAPECGTIYIRADGSIDPPTAPISTVDNFTYILTDNISTDANGIIIERDNMTLDGSSYTIQGPSALYGYAQGISFSGKRITIRNVKIMNFYFAMELNSSETNVIANTIADCRYGIRIYSSINNCVIGNTIINSTGCGIWLSSVSMTVVSNNSIISGESIYERVGIAILMDSSNNSVSRNTITNNALGVYLYYGPSNNTISGNIIENNTCGIRISEYSVENRIFHNNFFNNTQQVSASEYSYLNIWDDEYPSGGNYWSDYAGTDLFSGPYQNEPGSDKIGDTPYVIDANNQDGYPLMNPWQPPDIVLIHVTPSKTVVGHGYSLKINVTITNQGNKIEGFNITTYANAIAIQTQYITLTSGNFTTITFTWNTTGFAKGNYTISAYAWPVPSETDTADNNCTNGWVTVTWLGDLDGDFDVDEEDLWYFCAAFIDYYKIHVKDANCDFDDDCDIDEDDFWTFCAAFINYWKAH